MYQISSESPGV